MNSYTLPTHTIVRGVAYTYEILKVLGQGSFGITYLAKTRIKGPLGDVPVTVALKEFFSKELNERLPDGSVRESSSDSMAGKYRRDFRREAQNLSKLKHRHIINVLESFDANGTSYYSMEYIDGGSLDDYIRKNGGVGEQEAGDCIRQVADAMSYMHRNRMLHLDLKPKNVMRRSDGTLVLIDFGLSKQYTDDGKAESSTNIGHGTPGYAPTEQSEQGRGKTFAPTIDIYALGATYYKLLTGETPPTASEVLNDGLPEQVLRKKGVADSTISYIKSAMSPRSKERPQSVREFMSLLNGTEGGVNPRKIHLDKSSASIVEGSSLRLNASISRSKDDEKTQLLTGNTVRSWCSSDPSVAAVDESGTVTGIKPGVSVITVSYGGVSASCEVRVIPKKIPKPFPRWLYAVGTAVIAALILFFALLKPTTNPDDSDLSEELVAEVTGLSSASTNRENGHEWINLGLSVKWATMNVGASSPSDHGNYFAWGETSPKSYYVWGNLKYHTSGDTYNNVKFSKYVEFCNYGTVDNRTHLELSDDAAYANWGGRWRMPTLSEMKELEEKCIWTWTTQGGHNGYLVTSKSNGNAIFLPAAGYFDHHSESGVIYVGFHGEYWSSSLFDYEESADAFSLEFDSHIIYCEEANARYRGLSVRPVCP